MPTQGTLARTDTQYDRVISSANWLPAQRDAYRREIARRYAWRTEQQRPGSKADHNRLITKIRLRELERLYHHRYGHTLPNDDGGRDDLEIVANHIAHLRGEVVAHIEAWAAVWCPWMPQAEIDALAERVAASPVRYTADKLAWRLGLTMSERMVRGITTIGAVDMNAAERLELRKQKDRERKRAYRAARRTGNPRGRPTKNASAAGKVSIAADAFISTRVEKAENAGERARLRRASPVPRYERTAPSTAIVAGDEAGDIAPVMRPALSAGDNILRA